jgi:hypothetical protein
LNSEKLEIVSKEIILDSFFSRQKKQTKKIDEMQELISKRKNIN